MTTDPIRILTGLPETDALLDTKVFVLDGPDGVEKITAANVKAAVAESIANGTVFQTTAARLLEWAMDDNYRQTDPVYDANQYVVTSPIAWPDGSSGVYTTTANDAVFGLPIAWTLTHDASGKTVTQPAITLNSNGQVTHLPALTIS